MESGWDKLNKFKGVCKQKVTLIIAVRNEAENIDNLIDHIRAQTFDKDLLEVILIDDHSTDNTFEKLSDVKDIKLFSSDGFGKKSAIETGLKNASGEIIITTDGDCFFSPEWISKMTSPFINSKIKMVVGPVRLTGEKVSFFCRLQVLEFASLIGAGAGAIANKNAFMCNGANLAFRRTSFKNTNGEIQSGDDVFLLHHIKNNNEDIVFVKDHLATVSTFCKPNLSSFISQRLRWSAKTSSYKDRDAILISLCVFLVNFSIVFCLYYNFNFFIILLLLKFVSDFSFLKKLTSFFSIKDWTTPFLFMQLFYPLYIIFIAIVSQFVSFRWKGRTFKR